MGEHTQVSMKTISILIMAGLRFTHSTWHCLGYECTDSVGAKSLEFVFQFLGQSCNVVFGAFVGIHSAVGIALGHVVDILRKKTFIDPPPRGVVSNSK